MEGEGRSPKPPFARDDVKTARTEHRASVESVDLEDVEDVDDLEEIPPSVEDVSIDIEVEERASVQNLLAMTGEGWSLDEQQASLKEAAKEKESERTRREAAPPQAKPAL